MALGLLLPGAAFGDCGIVDKLAAQVGEIYDQEKGEVCASFTAADLLTQRMHKVGSLPPGERIHPLQMATMIPIQNGRDPNILATTYTNPGQVIEAVNKLKAQGVKLCTGSELALQSNGTKSAAGSIEGFLDRVNKGAADDRCSASGSTLGQMMQLSKNLALVSRKTWLDEFKHRCHTEIDGFGPDHFFQRLRVKESETHKPLSPSFEVDEVYRRTLDSVLDAGDIAAIGYDPDFLNEHPTGKPDSHWSSIVGRKPGPEGQCLYQLRNSWGTSCEGYPKELNCARGYLWVPAEKLFPHVHTLQFLEN